MPPRKDPLPPIEPLHPRWVLPVNEEEIEVEGLDTSAPVHDQIEQLEQLITIRLQNIDANFARAHQILSTRILPAVRRFAVNTEPVRDAARFWISFFEQAAQVRIPAVDDLSAVHTQQESQSDAEHEQEEPESGLDLRTPTELESNSMQGAVDSGSDNARVSHTFDPNCTPSESSFAPDDLLASTPVPHATVRFAQLPSGSSTSWAQSFQTPLERLDEGIRGLHDSPDSKDEPKESSVFSRPPSLQGSSSSIRALPQDPSSSAIFTSQSQAQQDKGKGRERQPQTLLKNVLSKNFEAQGSTSPLRPKGKSASKESQRTPRQNPFGRREDWDGIVDLSRVSSKDINERMMRSRLDERRAGRPNESASIPTPMLSPVRSTVGNRIMRTPGREAAARIGRDLVGDAARARNLFYNEMWSQQSKAKNKYQVQRPGAERGAGGSTSTVRDNKGHNYEGTSTSMQSARSIPSVVRSETTMDQSMDTTMRRFGLDPSKYAPSEANTNDESFDASFDDIPPSLVAAAASGRLVDDELARNDSSSSSDSFDEESPAPPFMFADQRESGTGDDSFMSDGDAASGSSDDDDDGVGIGPFGHVGAQEVSDEGDSFDDSFDDTVDRLREGRGLPSGARNDEEPTATVFGPPTALRHQQQQRGTGGLQLLGQDLADDGMTESTSTVTGQLGYGVRIGANLGRGGPYAEMSVRDTPTPATAPAPSLGPRRPERPERPERR